MARSDPFLYFVWLLGIVFIFLGFYYNPNYFTGVFVKYDIIPKVFITKVILADILSVIFGASLIIFSKKLLKYKKQVLLLVFMVAVFLVLAELLSLFWLCDIADNKQFKSYARWGDCDRPSLYQPHHYLSYVTTPNYNSGLNKHNSLGFRGDEINITKDPSIFRIVTLGGSTTYEERVEDYRLSYPYLLQKILNEKYGYSVEVINAGVGGYSSYESLINFIFRVQELEPDMVIIYHGINDVQTMLVDPNYYKGDNSGRRKYWSEPDMPIFYKSVFFRIVADTNPFGLEPYTGTQRVIGGVSSSEFNKLLNTTPSGALSKNKPIYFERNIRDIISLAKEDNIRVLLATWAYTLKFDDYMITEHYASGINVTNAVLKKIAKEENVWLYDYAAEMPKDLIYWADSRHVNEVGSELKAELFAKYIHKNNLISLKYRKY